MVTIKPNNPASAIVYVPNQGEIQVLPIKASALDFLDNLSDRKTGIIYKEALIKTWELLQQAIFLISSIFFLFLAVLIWVWGYAFNLGKESYQKLKPLLDSNTSGSEAFSAFIKWLLWLIWPPIKWIIDWANKQVERLGFKRIDYSVIENILK